jgi:hypothetical protein
MPDDPESKPRPKMARPLYLVVALVVVWCLGVGGVMSGCGTLQFYRETTHPSLELDSKMDPTLRRSVEAQHEARLEALNANQGRMIPLAAADVLLSGLLIVACARALSSRPRSHLLALQAIFANVVYAAADYFVAAPIRNAIVAAGVAHPPSAMPEIDPSQLATIYGWLFRFILVAHVAILGLAAFALTRPRVLGLFQQQEPEEEEP